MHRWIIPLIIVVLGLISYSTLASIVPELAMRQVGFLLAGLVIFIIIRNIPFQFFHRLAPLWYALLCILLVITLFMPESKGASRWIEFGLFSFQPSQLAIPSTLLFLGWFEKKNVTGLKQTATMMAIILVPAILIFAEPNLGTSLVFTLVTGIAIFFYSSWKQIGILIGVSVLIGIFSWFTVLQEYQKHRILSFMEPAATINTTGYNSNQATIAVGSGSLVGVGAGKGMQSHLKFLPEKHTDFFFASFAEEFGFVGSVILISLYLGLCSICFYIAWKSPSWDKTLFAAATGSFLGFQALYNIGMNSGLFPITGIPLPLASYGGTAILSTIGNLAIIDGILQHLPKKVTLHVK